MSWPASIIPSSCFCSHAVFSPPALAPRCRRCAVVAIGLYQLIISFPIQFVAALPALVLTALIANYLARQGKNHVDLNRALQNFIIRILDEPSATAAVAFAMRWFAVLC